MHTPKTAGTTLIQIIEQQFDEREIARWLYPFRLVDEPPEFFRQHRYFHGHVEYGLMRALLGRDPLAITMLREPVERYLSHFGNHRRVNASQIPDITLDVFNALQQTSLDDFVLSPPLSLVPLALSFQDLQAKFLASEFDGRSPAARQQLVATRQYTLPTPAFEQARQRLAHLSFVGLTERFQESLFLMAYTFGWPPVMEYKSFHTAQPRPQQRELRPELLREIGALNQLDQRVYRYGRELFQTRYEQMERELLEGYGGREHAHMRAPLASEHMVTLLDRHYRRRFAERTVVVPALKLEFDRKIPGSNWQTQERDPVHGGMRWIGPGRCASLDLPLAATSDSWLRFSVIKAIAPDVLDSLAVRVNDEPIRVERHSSRNQAEIYDGYVPQTVLARRPGCVRVTFEVDRTIRPVDIVPGSEDNRLLGIALNWVAVEAALPLAEEAVRLKKLTRAQEADLADVTRQLEAARDARDQAVRAHEELLGATQREVEAVRRSRPWRVALNASYRTLGRIVARIR